MRIQLKALQSHLEKGLRPCYLLSGDEPLQLGEASDAVRARAREEGFATRALLEVDRSFDWNRLAMEADTLSLFSDKKVIDLRIPSGKPGSTGGAALMAYASRPPPDTVLLITLPKLERYIRKLADGTLKHETIFNDKGHGALVYNERAMPLNNEKLDIVVTGPRRSLFSGGASTVRPYFSVPFGDMMIAGCFGMLSATSDLLPKFADEIKESLKGAGGAGTPPWEIM